MSLPGVTSYDYGILPEDIISQILSYLKPRDFKRAISTCSAWYQESLRPRFQHNFNVVMRNTVFNGTTEMQQYAHIFNGNRVFKSINFQYVNFQNTDFIQKIPEMFLNSLRHIQFHNCEMKFPEFVNLIVQMPNLESLTIEYVNYDSKFFRTTDFSINKSCQLKRESFDNVLVKLTSFKMYASQVNSFSFLEAFKKMTNLEEFSFRVFPHLHSVDVIETIVDRNSSLKKLEIACNIWNMGMEYANLNLKDVHLSTSSIYFETLFVNNRGIENLKLYYLSEANRDALITYMTNIRCFELVKFEHDCEDVVHQQMILRWMAELPNITKFIAPISIENFTSIVVKPKPTLCVLKLKGKFDAQQLLQITQMCPNLEELSLIPTEWDYPEDIQIIFKNLTKLRKLVIQGNLKSKNLKRTDGGDYDDPSNCISNLRYLNYLKISGPLNFISLKDIMRLEHLEVLDVVREFKVESDDIKYFIDKYPAIAELSFYGVKALTAELCATLLRQSKNLEVLNIFGCSNAGVNYNNKSFMPNHH